MNYGNGRLDLPASKPTMNSTKKIKNGMFARP